MYIHVYILFAGKKACRFEHPPNVHIFNRKGIILIFGKNKITKNK
jgi:hypothetical protein